MVLQRLGLLFCLMGSGLCSLSLHPHHFNEKVFNDIPSIQPRSENRLLNTTLPISYDLDLTTNIHVRDTTFHGIANIRFRVLESINRVRINSYLLEISSCLLLTSSSINVPVTSCTTVDRFLDVTVPSSLEVNQEYVLQLVYQGTHRSPSEGFHSSYYTYNGATQYLASTQFQSVFAREAFPCFDEPYYRVPIKLTMRHDPSFNALSNAEIESSNNGVTVFKETWQLPSYLIAFVVSDFQCTARRGKQRICAQPNRMDEVDLAVEAADRILTWMEQTFDETYEQEKLDHIAIPTFQFGGMENWGLVVYHPWYLLFKEGVDTVNDKIGVTSVISHELAHMFFGNLITPKWWTYLYLSEGMATLYEFYATHAAYPELRMNELFTVDALHRVFRVDATGNTRPMLYYVDTVDGIEGIFDSIAYLKAGSIFRMIKFAIGEATFDKALQKYLNVNKNSGVDEQPLYRALEEAITEDQAAPVGIIASVMDTWSLQGGYPLVTVVRDYTTNTITIRQSEFVASTNPPASNKLWGIPITFTKKTGADFNKNQANYWFQTREQTVANDAIATDWVIFNVQQSGYYRVNYDERNWEELIEELIKGDHEIFPPTNRAQMIDDINVLANFQVVENRLRLALMEYLSRETDMIPLQAASVHLKNLSRMLATSSRYTLFKEYVKKMLEDNFRDAETFWYADEDVNTFKSRSVFIDLACTVGIEACQTLTRTLLFSELKTKMELVNKEDREMIYCHGLKTANSKMFQMFLRTYDDLYNETPAEVEQPHEEGSDYHDYSNINRMTRIMGCYGNSDEIQDMLSNILAPDFPYQRYRSQILQSIVANGHFELVLDFFVENNVSIDNLEEGALASIIIAMSREVLTMDQEEKLKAYLNELEDFSVPSQVEVNVRSNLEWSELHMDAVETWLVTHYLEGSGSVRMSKFSLFIVILVAFIGKFML